VKDAEKHTKERAAKRKERELLSKHTHITGPGASEKKGKIHASLHHAKHIMKEKGAKLKKAKHDKKKVHKVEKVFERKTKEHGVKTKEKIHLEKADCKRKAQQERRHKAAREKVRKERRHKRRVRRRMNERKRKIRHKARVWRLKVHKAHKLSILFKHKEKHLARKKLHIERRLKNTHCAKTKRRYRRSLLHLQRREKGIKHHIRRARHVVHKLKHRERHVTAHTSTHISTRISSTALPTQGTNCRRRRTLVRRAIAVAPEPMKAYRL